MAYTETNFKTKKALREAVESGYDLIMSNRANEISDKKLSELSEETGALRIEYIQEGAPSFIVKVCQDYQDMILAEISARKIGYSSYIGKSCKNTIQ
jgi:hypothetical protein